MRHRSSLYFKAQRALLLEERKAQQAQAGRSSQADSGETLFSSMAKTIAARWKRISKEEMKYYSALAEKDTQRYNEEMRLYNIKKEQAKRMKEQADGTGEEEEEEETEKLPASSHPRGNPLELWSQGQSVLGTGGAAFTFSQLGASQLLAQGQLPAGIQRVGDVAVGAAAAAAPNRQQSSSAVQLTSFGRPQGQDDVLSLLGSPQGAADGAVPHITETTLALLRELQEQQAINRRLREEEARYQASRRNDSSRF